MSFIIFIVTPTLVDKDVDPEPVVTYAALSAVADYVALERALAPGVMFATPVPAVT